MIHSLLLAASLLCEGNIKTNTGSTQHVNIALNNITNESIELGLAYGSILLERDLYFTYSALFDEFGSIVKIRLAKNTGKAHYTYMNYNSDHELKSAGSGWLSCRP